METVPKAFNPLGFEGTFLYATSVIIMHLMKWLTAQLPSLLYPSLYTVIDKLKKKNIFKLI